MLVVKVLMNFNICIETCQMIKEYLWMCMSRSTCVCLLMQPLEAFHGHVITVWIVSHHDVAVDEALAVASGFEMGVLFCAGDPDVPHTSPSFIKLQVYWVDPWVVRGHSVTHVNWNVVFLDVEDTHRKTKTHVKGYVHYCNTQVIGFIQLWQRT